MDLTQELSNFFSQSNNELSLAVLLFNFFCAVFISNLVRVFYIRCSFSLTGKMHIGPIIPILTSIVFLVIVVVKSSLALSLGLVGALSIVRFRTPIKEPEELVYLFLAIAIGLGFGAGYALITSLITLSILIIVYFFLNQKKILSSEFNLVINWTDEKITYENIFEIIEKNSSSLKLIRFENNKDFKNSVFLIELSEKSNLDLVINKLRLLDKNISVSFFESKLNF
jgi:hypothetical protein